MCGAGINIASRALHVVKVLQRTLRVTNPHGLWLADDNTQPGRRILAAGCGLYWHPLAQFACCGAGDFLPAVARSRLGLSTPDPQC